MAAPILALGIEGGFGMHGGPANGFTVHATEESERMRITITGGLLAVLLGATISSVGAEDQQSAVSSFVSLKLEGSCDQNNTRLWLVNSHTFKTVATTVRWKAAGGKDLTEQFYPLPNSVREIGCAAEAEIIDAKFVDF
jgi:hypothetical protein